MKLLEERILRDGKIGAGNVLKVDSFVNHQIDVPFMNEVGKEFKRLFDGVEINKIVKDLLEIEVALLQLLLQWKKTKRLLQRKLL
jgi:hypothetical protein